MRYQAPLLNCEDPNRDPDYFMVCLAPGYSLKKHKETVTGVDFDAIVEFVLDIPDQVIYSAKLADDSLAEIRADVGVDVVQCDRTIPMPDDRRE